MQLGNSRAQLCCDVSRSRHDWPSAHPPPQTMILCFAGRTIGDLWSDRTESSRPRKNQAAADRAQTRPDASPQPSYEVMTMAIADSNARAPVRRTQPMKRASTRPTSAKRSTIPANHRNRKPAQAPKAAPPPDRQGTQTAERGLRIRVRGRLKTLIQAELLNLERAESVLRCLALSMDAMSLGPTPYFPDMVHVAGDLVERSIVDLSVLYDGRIPDQLMAARKMER